MPNRRILVILLVASLGLTGCVQCMCPGRDTNSAVPSESPGESLLRRFPPPEWGKDRMEAIHKRSVLEGVFPSYEEELFLRNFDEWESALKRRDQEQFK